MNSFDVELKALIEKWLGLGASQEDIVDALQDEADIKEDKLLAQIKAEQG
jgi:hypothetical protein